MDLNEVKPHVRQAFQDAWERQRERNATKARPIPLVGSLEESVWAASYAAEPFLSLNTEETRVHRANAAVMMLRARMA